MAEDASSSLKNDSSVVTTTDSRVVNHFKKPELKKENSLYPEPVSKCYIGSGNNGEL